MFEPAQHVNFFVCYAIMLRVYTWRINYTTNKYGHLYTYSWKAEVCDKLVTIVQHSEMIQ